MEPVLADVALESSNTGVRQLVGFQHGGPLKLGRTKVALERRVRGVNDHVCPEAARPEEPLLADRTLERLHIGVHQLVIAQRLPMEQLLLAHAALERPAVRVHLGLMRPQLIPLLEFEASPRGNWLRFAERLVSILFPMLFSSVFTLDNGKKTWKHWHTWNRRLQCLHMKALNVSWSRRWSFRAEDLGIRNVDIVYRPLELHITAQGMPKPTDQLR